MIHRHNYTLIIVDQPALKKHPYGYQTALNIADHLIWYHIYQDPKSYGREDYKWKFVESLTDEDILSCETPFALVCKLGTYFNSSLMVMNLPEQASLVGHILDKKNDYYELHDQCFLVKVADYDTTQNTTYRSVNRSVENFHHDYTPISVTDGGEEIDIKGQKRHGADLISNLLRAGKVIEPFPLVIRHDKGYIYPHDVSCHIHNVRSRPFILFPVSTDPSFQINISNFENFVGSANGLQFLEYTHPDMESIHLFDLHLDAIEFTKDIVFDWDWKNTAFADLVKKHHRPETIVHDKEIPDDYILQIIERNTRIFETIKRIRSGDIMFSIRHHDMLDIHNIDYARNKPKTLIYYTNILSYAPTFHALSAIDAALSFQQILQQMDDDSAFMGMVPFRGNDVYTKQDLSLNEQLKLPWREELYDNYYKSRVKAL